MYNSMCWLPRILTIDTIFFFFSCIIFHIYSKLFIYEKYGPWFSKKTLDFITYFQFSASHILHGWNMTFYFFASQWTYHIASIIILSVWFNLIPLKNKEEPQKRSVSDCPESKTSLRICSFEVGRSHCFVWPSSTFTMFWWDSHILSCWMIRSKLLAT